MRNVLLCALFVGLMPIFSSCGLMILGPKSVGDTAVDGSTKILHSFSPSQPFGANPYRNLLYSNGVLYGMASAGGTSGQGNIFSISADGLNFTVLHNFTGGPDGGTPYGSLIILGNTLYGLTYEGSINNEGAIFSINTDGSNFTVLHNFPSAVNGAYPMGSLVASGTSLYGMTNGGGTDGYGTVFSMGIDGSSFTVLHSFTQIDAYPQDGLIVSGGVLYGMTCFGGVSGSGLIFSLNTDGSNFNVLHQFTGGSSDGSQPNGNLILSGGTLYGLASEGGTDNKGVIFSIGTNGTGFSVLYSFTNGTDGANPYDTLVLSGTTLYGMANGGGTNGEGTVFSFDTTGSVFTTLHSFSGSDGASPVGGLTLSGSTFYGMTYSGGSDNVGAVFCVNIDGSDFTTLYSFTNSSASESGTGPTGSLIQSGNILYGTAYAGGVDGLGTIFSVGTDGSNYQVLHSFTGGAVGQSPHGDLILVGSTLYGTSSGGALTNGTIFSVGIDGSNFTTLYSFTGGSDGGNPQGSLILSGGTFYGLAACGGNGGTCSGDGTIFSIGLDGSNFTVVYTFTGTEGADPVGSLILSGTTLYGMAHNNLGGLGNGVVFSVGKNGANFTVLHSFTGGSDGANPTGSLVLSGNTLYGMAEYGGSSDNGVIFSVATNGTGFTPLHSFTGGVDGAIPYGTLTLSGSTLYGMAAYGGTSGSGTIFSINTDGSGFAPLYNFNGGTTDGAYPFANLLMTRNAFYGTTNGGGLGGSGTVFSFAMN